MDDCCSGKAKALEVLACGRQRNVLVVALLINAVLFVVELVFGIVARSSAMMADSVDMLGDAIVYALSLYALSRSAHWQAGAALAKAGLILLFGVGILIETGVKIVEGTTPSSAIMLGVTAIALSGNLICLGMLGRLRHLNVNMASTFECSRNDVIANVGVLVAGGLVTWFATGWPDIVVSLAIAILFLVSALRVSISAWPEWRGQSGVAALR